MRLTYLVVILLSLFVGVAIAQEVVAQLPAEPTVNDLVMAVVQLFGDWKGLSAQAKISAVIFLVLGATKNSLLAPLWNKLGDAKFLAGPALSLLGALILVQPFTLQTAIAAITTGAAAGYFSQLLDYLKTLKGIGPILTSIIDIIGVVLKKPEQVK